MLGAQLVQTLVETMSDERLENKYTLKCRSKIYWGSRFAHGVYLYIYDKI